MEVVVGAVRGLDVVERGLVEVEVVVRGLVVARRGLGIVVPVEVSDFEG